MEDFHSAMRSFMISTLSSTASRRGRAAYNRHQSGGYVFSGSTPLQDDGGCNIRWLMNIMMQNHRCFMSTHTNPLHTHTSSCSCNKSNLKGEESDAIAIEVISREHIKPSSPTPQNLRYYKLSIFDQIEVPIYHPLMFFYQNYNNKINKNVEEVILDRSNHLKQSLSETLTRMYPFAGKVASELHIDCNDEGVYYIETRVDDRLKNVLKNPDNNFLKRLIPFVDSVPNQPMSGSYVSMVQVNFFKCGGVSITVQNSHKFADARSSIIFMNSWAAIARRDANQIYPNFVSSMFPQSHQFPFSPYIPPWYLIINPAYLKPGKCATKRFVFDSLALQKLKTEASKHQPVSRVVAILSLLWRCITIETKSKPSVLHTPVDVRSRCSPPLPEYSIGNVLSGAIVKFDPDESDLKLESMAGQLKNVIANVNGKQIEDLKGENGHVRFLESVRNSMEAFSDYKREYYLTSSMCNSGTKEADFGWGKPVWSCTGNQLNEDIPLFTNRMLLMDSCSGDGIEAWVTLEKQVMDALKCNPELLSYASVDPSPL